MGGGRAKDDSAVESWLLGGFSCPVWASGKSLSPHKPRSSGLKSNTQHTPACRGSQYLINARPSPHTRQQPCEVDACNYAHFTDEAQQGSRSLLARNVLEPVLSRHVGSQVQGLWGDGALEVHDHGILQGEAGQGWKHLASFLEGCVTLGFGSWVPPHQILFSFLWSC